MREKKQAERPETVEEMLKRLGFKSLKETLQKPIFLINFGAVKNMQAVVDEAFDEITKAKQGWYWQKVVDCLNENTNANVKLESIKTMYKRAKKNGRVRNRSDRAHASIRLNDASSLTPFGHETAASVACKRSENILVMCAKIYIFKSLKKAGDK